MFLYAVSWAGTDTFICWTSLIGIADTIADVENGLDLLTATKEAHTKIYQSINPAFDSEVQFSIDTCYRDIPAVDMAVYNITRQLLDDAHEVYLQKSFGCLPVILKNDL